jgi:hypothetical protein
MFEAGLDQGAGLRHLTPQKRLRLVPVIRHGDGKAELALLWQLCQALIGLGMPVAVLDTCTRESADAPGLIDLLDEQATFHDIVDADLPWAILPARQGWQRIAHGQAIAAADQQRLSRLFSAYSVLIVYGSVDELAPALASTGVRPLVPVVPLPQTLVSAYQAMKTLISEALLLPTAAIMVTEPTAPSIRQALQARKTLQSCFARHIGCYLDSMTVKSFFDEEEVGNDLQMLALRLLESAMALDSAREFVQQPSQFNEQLH